MMDDDLAMLRACIEAGLFCLGVGGLWVIVSVVREWWRKQLIRENRVEECK